MLKNDFISSILIRFRSRTLYECVDWNHDIIQETEEQWCLTLYECVDWNFHFDLIFQLNHSRTLYECVDWNTWGDGYELQITESHSIRVRGLKSKVQYPLLIPRCRTLYECVDWNYVQLVDVFITSRGNWQWLSPNDSISFHTSKNVCGLKFYDLLCLGDKASFLDNF